MKTAGEDFKKIYMKKDINHAVRKEWKRLHDAEVRKGTSRERQMPSTPGTENYQDGVVIGR